MFHIRKPNPPVRCHKQIQNGRCTRRAVSLCQIRYSNGSIDVLPLCYDCRKAFQKDDMLVEWIPLTAENCDPNQYHLFTLEPSK